MKDKIRKRVYIAGAITPTNPEMNPVIEYGMNVKKFLDAAAILMAHGFAPYVPALDFPLTTTDWFLDDDDFYETSLAFLDACDVMYIIPGYEKSKGTLNEIEYALKRKKHITIYNDLDTLIQGEKK